MGRHLELNNCIMTSAEAALPTLPNIALNALYVTDNKRDNNSSRIDLVRC